MIFAMKKPAEAGYIGFDRMPSLIFLLMLS
jgi:hypothetical protein